MREQGTLFIVATPIGNISDITERARAVLARTDFIACEDTRRAIKLLRQLSIDPADKSLRSFHALNENDLAEKIIASLGDGQDVALISDAGTPVLSDPGFPLIKEAFVRGAHVVPVPGPSALTACLSVCPIPMHDFRFVGFIERKTEPKKAQLNALLECETPVVCFESPNRLLDTLRRLSELGGGGRGVFIGRELTKLHEEKLFDSVDRMIEVFSGRERVLGECVLVLAPTEEQEHRDVSRLIDLFVNENIPPSSTARLIAKLSGITRQEAYRRLKARQRPDD